MLGVERFFISPLMFTRMPLPSASFSSSFSSSHPCLCFHCFSLPFPPVSAIKFTTPVHNLMKKLLLLTTIVTLGLLPAFAQMGSHSMNPQFGGAMNKLFGANQTFTAALEVQATTPNGAMTLPGKISFDNGKTRFEMNMSDMRGSQFPPSALVQMKAMGMDSVISISRPDLKLMYLVYPGMNSYAEIKSQDMSASTDPDDYTVVSTDAGKETVDGHDCVKKQVTVTGKDGNKFESTVWDATDLKSFPVKIVLTPTNSPPATILFRNIAFVKPDAGLFNAPAGLTKYDSLQTMMQTEMAKHAASMTPPPGQMAPPGGQ
jgi:hypothetical protein